MAGRHPVFFPSFPQWHSEKCEWDTAYKTVSTSYSVTRQLFNGVETGLSWKQNCLYKGSKTYEWASYRGCFCIDAFYQRGRFSRCEACPKDVRGYVCNETILVKEGYWWTFRDYNESWEYQRFVDALMTPDEKFNHADVNFTGVFSKPYPCPKAASCLGLLNSVRKPCKTGYGGPLCDVRVT